MDKSGKLNKNALDIFYYNRVSRPHSLSDHSEKHQLNYQVWKLQRLCELAAIFWSGVLPIMAHCMCGLPPLSQTGSERKTKRSYATDAGIYRFCA